MAETTGRPSCHRCSVRRVNLLMDLVGKARDREEAAARRLKLLSSTAKERGVNAAGRVLEPGLDDGQLRALCWNISSVLTDEDLERLGISLKRKW